jgi:DNA polymerase-3 subunit delta
MMASHRMVVVKEANSFTEKEWDELQPVIERPLESTVLVFVASKVDRRKRVIKKLLERAETFEAKRLYDDQVPEWVRKLAKRHSLALTSDAEAALLDLVGPQLADLNSELMKLAQYMSVERPHRASGAESGLRVEVDDVHRVVSRVRVDTVFDMTDALGRKDRAGALLALVRLLEAGESPIAAVSLIGRHLRILRLLRLGAREGLTGPKLAARAGVNPYFLKSYQSQVRLWSDSGLDQSLQAVALADRALKSSPVSAHVWLESLVIQICDEGQAQAALAKFPAI